jgi:uncharacterized protein
LKSSVAAVLAAYILAFPAVADAQTMAHAALSGTRLEISVRGEVKRVPDVAVISTGVITQSADAATVMRDNAARMARVLAALKRAGVADKDVTTSAVNLSPQYRYNNNQPPVITGYQANNQVTVRFRDITRSGAILDALVKEGSNEINGPSLTIDKPEAALDEARVAAITAGRARAEVYANAAGMKIKRIISISENDGMSVVPRPMMTMMAKSAEADTVIMRTVAGDDGDDDIRTSVKRGFIQQDLPSPQKQVTMAVSGVKRRNSNAGGMYGWVFKLDYSGRCSRCAWQIDYAGQGSGWICRDHTPWYWWRAACRFSWENAWILSGR